MDLEFHQLELRHADLRIQDRGRYGRMMASLAAQGQQVPVVVVEEAGRYVLIDGYMRVQALQQMGQDTVAATAWPISETEALMHHHHLSASSRSALEQAWLLARLREQGLSLEELAKRLCRSKSWVSRRLALVSALDEQAQAKVRQGTMAPHAAMKYLVPLARANKGQCQKLVKALGDTRVSDRDVAALYAGWRHADAIGKQRLCEAPLLYLRALEAQAADKPATDEPGSSLAKDLAILGAVAWRARQQVHKELGLDATYKRSELCACWRAAQEAWDKLTSALQKALCDAGPDDPDRHPQTS